MSKMVQNMVLAVFVGLIATTALAAPDDAKAERDKNAKQVATAWFTSLMQGETAVTTSLSAAPFSFDRKHEVKTLPELKTLYDQIVRKKGERDLKPTAVKVNTSSPERVELVLMIEDEGVTITVKPGEAFRVIGFSD